MKNFPDKFPIRYAILINDHIDKDSEDYFDIARHKVLWDKLIKLLQTKSLDIKDLSLRYRAVGFSYQNTKLCDVPELNVQEKWADELAKKLAQSIPEGQFSHGYGLAFDLGLYSYRGSAEIPLFWQIYSHMEDEKYVGERLGLFGWGYHPKFIDLGNKIYKQYKQIMRGNITEWERFKSSQENYPIAHLTIPNSQLWHLLDKGQNNGFISPYAEEMDIDENALKRGKQEKRPSKMSVIVSRSLHALMWEEMMALYRVSSFCNNCGQALPFNYKGKYCLEAKENQDCIRERARKRARARITRINSNL